MSPETVAEVVDMLVLLERIGMQCAICGEARGPENVHAEGCTLDALFAKIGLSRSARNEGIYPRPVADLLEDVAFVFEPKLTKEKFHRLLGHLTKWSIEEIDVHLMGFTARKDRIDP